METRLKIVKIPKSELPQYEAIQQGEYDFMQQFRNDRIPPIIYLSGSRGQGKTALMCKIAENYLRMQKEMLDVVVYVMGFSRESQLPVYFNHIDNLHNLSKKGILLIDEAGLTKRPDFNDLVSISGHKSISIVFGGQTLKQITPTEMSQVTGFAYKKPSYAELNKGMIRREFKDVMQLFNDNLDVFNDKGMFYYEDSTFKGWLKVGLPSFWNNDISQNQKKW